MPLSLPSSPAGAFQRVCHAFYAHNDIDFILFVALRVHVFIRLTCISTTGYDEGGFSASVGLKSFQNDFNLVASHWTHDPTGLANRKANITSFNVLGAAFGSLLALFFNDRLGRLRAWQLAVLVWATGLFIQVFSSGIYGLLLFARIWGGLGAGALTGRLTIGF